MPKGFRWVWVAAAAAITVAVLSLSYSSYENIGVKKPLLNALLSESDVAGADVHRDGIETVIEIRMKSVPDLAVSYATLNEVVKDHLGTSPFRIEIKDAKTPSLEAAYHSIHYYVEEASLRGTFGAMIQDSAGALEKAGFDEYKLSVDKERIYVQISDSGGYLYKIIDRASREGGAGA